MSDFISYIVGLIIGAIIGLIWFHEPHTSTCKNAIQHKCRDFNSTTKKEQR